jgi:NAD(P)-dependent dehydrogenase (short-subunit alcohol dehydrogenase family)
VIAGVDLSGRRAIVTGRSSGIAIETARALPGAGADVTLAVRNTDAGKQTATDITATTRNRCVHVRPLDPGDLASIGAFVAGWSGPLHRVVNNAGVLLTERRLTPHGVELTFATNHLGHFSLALGLREALAAVGDSRVVALSSEAHLRAPQDLDDINFVSRSSDPMLAYGQSKSAAALFAVEPSAPLGRARDRGQRRSSGRSSGPAAPVTSTRASSLHPRDRGLRVRTPEQGVATSVLPAASSLLDGVSGRSSRTATRRPSSARTVRVPFAASPSPRTCSTTTTQAVSGTGQSWWSGDTYQPLEIGGSRE